MTTKGEHRRDALVEAAAALLLEQGFGAVSHRAVATRAGLPLAATTYYFASLDDLLGQAASRLGEAHAARARILVERLPARSLGADATARRIVNLVLPDDDDLTAWYERYLEAGRAPVLRTIVMAWNSELRAHLVTVLTRTGHEVEPDLVLAVVDGFVLTALAEGSDPHRAAARGVAGLLRRCSRPPSAGSG